MIFLQNLQEFCTTKNSISEGLQVLVQAQLYLCATLGLYYLIVDNFGMALSAKKKRKVEMTTWKMMNAGLRILTEHTFKQIFMLMSVTNENTCT